MSIQRDRPEYARMFADLEAPPKGLIDPIFPDDRYVKLV